MAESSEGGIVGKGTDDEAFHAPILGDDQLPPEILARLKAEAERRGIDPRIVQR